MSSLTSKVLAKVDIVKLIGEYISIEKYGDSYRALCPFHPDKDPSFSVSPRLQIFRCFGSGCQVGGNAINFVALYEGISYYQALTVIARKIGRPDLAPDKTEKITDIFEINERVLSLYQTALFTQSALSEKARMNLKDRRITQETARLFGLGYSPNSWTWLMNRGLDRKLLLKAGLLRKSEAGLLRDFFKNRIIFPIYHQGKLVGFTGRTLGMSRKTPKYLNSRESDWFRKRDIIYGWDLNRKSIQLTKQVVIVEGQFDVLQLSQRGITNTVAISGSYFGADQAAFLKKSVSSAIVFSDGDEAGIETAVRLGKSLAGQGIKLKIIFVKGKDPDDIAKYQRRFDWNKLNLEHSYSLETFAFLHGSLERALEAISAFSNKIDVSHALKHLSELSGHDERHLEHWLIEFKKSPLQQWSIDPEKTQFKLQEELLLLAAIKEDEIPLSKYLRRKLRDDQVNLKTARSEGFTQQLAENSDYLSRLYVLEKISNIEKYTTDLKTRLTLHYIQKDVKKLKKEYRNDSNIQHLEEIERLIKRVSKLKLKLTI